MPRLLVVDDDSMNRDMLSRRLARHGYEVATAADGFEALELTAIRPFDLVLLDVMMPGIDGFEVLRRLRQTYPVHSLPVVMATARGGSDSVVKALQLGANDYVTKPFDFDVLLARIQTQLVLRRAVVAAAAANAGDALTLAAGAVAAKPPRTELPWTGPAARRIGRYQLEEQIGKGGMGVVYLARDPALDRPVAVKMLRDDILAAAPGDSREPRERFAREARAVARLSHPNIVTIFDVGEDEGRPFIVMEFLSGETLARLVSADQALPLRRRLELMEQLCRGLAHAHDAGIVHRDVKPSNLIVTTDGVLKILDFGIARLKSRLAVQHETQTTTVIGTLAYMAPEQLAGEPGDVRSDVFAAGAVFYELLSRRRARPVTGMLPRELLAQRPEPIARLCPELPPDLVAIVDKALQLDPEARYQNLATMARELRALLAVS
jgi:CheY-like chemotaxis protein/predicted Ser/Thr protein kinase